MKQRMPISRRDLYNLVWKKPVSKVARELGVTDTGLAKICKSMGIPRPPRGYWAKLEAGKDVKRVRLPPIKKGMRENVTIGLHAEFLRTRPRVDHLIDPNLTISVSVPDTLNSAHPAVKDWLVAHKKKENFPYSDTGPLTDRDTFRFRVISAFLKHIKKHGVSFVEGEPTGALWLSSGTEKIEVVITEKMSKAYGQDNTDIRGWSAFENRFQNGLRPTGFLKFEIRTYTNGGPKGLWLEKPDFGVEQALSLFIRKILEWFKAAEVSRKQRAEEDRLNTLAQKEAEEILRFKHRELERLNTFRQMSTDFCTAGQLRRFVRKLRELPDLDYDEAYGDMTVGQWISWAEKKIYEIDPLVDGGRLVFKRLGDV